MNNTEHGSKPIRNEVTGTPLHKNEVVGINNELNFELLSARQQLNRILTAANVSSVDEVVALLERKDLQGIKVEHHIGGDADTFVKEHRDKLQGKERVELLSMLKDFAVTSCKKYHHFFNIQRDPQGFLINTDIDDTMSKPFSDEEIEQAAKEYAENENSAYTNDYYGFIQGANFANRQQAGWIDVKDRLPSEECKSVLVYAPRSFPKNSRCVVAEYKDDAKGFYSESGEDFMEDVTHWCELPNQPLPPKPKQ